MEKINKTKKKLTVVKANISINLIRDSVKDFESDDYLVISYGVYEYKLSYQCDHYILYKTDARTSTPIMITKDLGMIINTLHKENILDI